MGDRQWKALLQLVKRKVEKWEQELVADDLSDRAEAKRKSLYAAAMNGKFRLLKMIIVPDEVLAIAVDVKAQWAIRNHVKNIAQKWKNKFFFDGCA